MGRNVPHTQARTVGLTVQQYPLGRPACRHPPTETCIPPGRPSGQNSRKEEGRRARCEDGMRQNKLPRPQPRRWPARGQPRSERRIARMRRGHRRIPRIRPHPVGPAGGPGARGRRHRVRPWRRRDFFGGQQSGHTGGRAGPGRRGGRATGLAGRHARDPPPPGCGSGAQRGSGHRVGPSSAPEDG